MKSALLSLQAKLEEKPEFFIQYVFPTALTHTVVCCVIAMRHSFGFSGCVGDKWNDSFSN